MVEFVKLEKECNQVRDAECSIEIDYEIPYERKTDKHILI